MLADAHIEHLTVLRRGNRVIETADAILRTLDEILALPCSHDGACSGQLRLTPNGLAASVVCDCGATVRELPDSFTH